MMIADRIGYPQRSPEALELAILKALADGPRFKWQLREELHEPDAYLIKILTRLRDDGKVKVIGHCLDKRAWALWNWQPPPKARTIAPKISLEHKPAAPSTSWWIDVPRDEFAAKVAARDRERQGSTVAYGRRED